MKITLCYDGELCGITYTPLLLMMLANFLEEHGYSVELLRVGEGAEFDGIPSDNFLDDNYSKLRGDIAKLTSDFIDFTKLKVDYDLMQERADINGVITSLGCKYHSCTFCPQNGNLL
jgi:hypothetical protein